MSPKLRIELIRAYFRHGRCASPNRVCSTAGRSQLFWRLGFFAILAVLDLRLETLSGFGTSDLQSFYSATQYNAAFMVWPSRYAVRAGFNWGLDYLLIPLYAMSFFYSGIIAREALPAASRLRRTGHPAGGGARRGRPAGRHRECAAIFHDAVGGQRYAGAHGLYPVARQDDGADDRYFAAVRGGVGAGSGAQVGAAERLSPRA